MVPFCSANSTDISPQPGGNIPVPVGGDFRPGDGEAVPPYFVYGKRIHRSRAEIYPRPSVKIFVPPCRGRRPDVPSARQRRAARLPPCGAVDTARRRRFSSQRWRSRAAILCVWQADSTQLGRKYTRARRRRFSSQRWRSRAAILCVWQADSTQLGRK